MSDYENITCPITLVCAGNRRKEQNVVRKSKGFSWGPAGLATALFTGVPMWDVIRRAKPLKKGKYLCMEGADQLPNGYYGTSLKMNWVRDPNRGIMLAHGMNGEPLRPDHGKPLRAVSYMCRGFLLVSRCRVRAGVARVVQTNALHLGRPWTNRWSKRQVAQKAYRHRRTKRQLVPHIRQSCPTD